MKLSRAIDKKLLGNNYLGNGLSGLLHVVYEVLDNSADEYLAGYGDKIELEFLNNGGIQIRDYGRGIPVGKKKGNKDVLEVLLTELHAGGKFGGEESGSILCPSI